METRLYHRPQARHRRQLVGARIEEDLLAQVDLWAETYRTSRSQALRSLVVLGLRSARRP